MTDTDTDALRRALHATAPPGCRYAGLYIEDTRSVGLRFAGSAVVDFTDNQSHGASVRHITDQDVRYRSADVTGTGDLLRLIRDEPPSAALHGATPHAATRRPDGVTDADAAGIMAELAALSAAIDAGARDHDPRVDQVLIDVERHRRRVLVVTPDTVATDARDLLYLTIRAVARADGTTVTSYYTPGTSDLSTRWDAEEIGREAAARAVRSLAARPAPIRTMPVVVGPGRGMVLIHEACCHPLEGDEVLRGSIYTGRIGDRIGEDCLHIDDDPTVPGAVGAHRFDDEGVPAATTSLVEAGVLRSYLTDHASALRLGARPTGNGRREGYRAMPLPRMTNTCVRAGSTSPDSIIADTAFGLYAQHVGGGEVVESTGDFVFRVTSGYLIENGRLTDPVRDTTVAGNGAAVLAAIDAVGDDVRVGAAKCGKFGQTLPVGVVGPTLRIRSLLVGGTQQ